MEKLIILIFITTLISTVILKCNKVNNKYLFINLIMQIILCSRSWSIGKVIIFSSYSIILVLIVKKDIIIRIIENKSIIFLMIISIANILISTPHIKKQIILGFIAAIIISLIIILAESITRKEILGGGDIKLIIVTGAIVGVSNIALICFISAITTYLLKKEGNPLAPGFLAAVLFYI